MSKPANARQRRRMGIVASLGCVICKGPAIIHHCGTHMGGGRNHDKIIPLCQRHHQYGGEGISIHDGKKAWEKIHGTEEQLLILINHLVE